LAAEEPEQEQAAQSELAEFEAEEPEQEQAVLSEVEELAPRSRERRPAEMRAGVRKE